MFFKRALIVLHFFIGHISVKVEILYNVIKTTIKNSPLKYEFQICVEPVTSKTNV